MYVVYKMKHNFRVSYTSALSRMKVTLNFQVNISLTKLKVFRPSSNLSLQSRLTEH